MAIGKGLAWIGDLDPNGMNIASFARGFDKLLPHFDGVVTGLGLDTSSFDAPEFFGLLSVFGILDDTPAGKCMSQRAHFASRATG